MLLQVQTGIVPGTILNRNDVDGLTGMPFLRHLFFATDGVMMATIRNVAGIDTSTIQNWVKRGWVANSRRRHYDPEQVAHILIINMLRSCMQLDDIDFIIRYINGEVGDTSDDIVSDIQLYDYICRILDAMDHASACGPEEVRQIVRNETADYREPVGGAKQRLMQALEIIVVTYCAATVKSYADNLFAEIRRS